MRKNKPYTPDRESVSYSMLVDFAECKEKARFRASGMKSKIPSYPLTFGSINHEVLGLVHQKIGEGKITKVPGRKRVAHYVKKADEEWRKQNPRAGEKATEFMELSCGLVEEILPRYFKYWKKDLFVMKWRTDLTEQFHRIPFQVSGHDEVDLNMRMDSAYEIEKGVEKGLWLFETKTSSKIVEDDLIDTLPMGLQNGMYLKGLTHMFGVVPRGVLYNFIRRPGIYRRKEESIKDYAARCGEDVDKRPEFYFIRISIDHTVESAAETETQLQGAVLEYVKWRQGKRMHYKNTSACLGKYGRCAYLPICAHGDFSNFYGGKDVRPKR
jgi:hypothetical protein